MGIAGRAEVVAAIVRLVLAGGVCAALGWRTGLAPTALFVPYLLYEGVAVAWPRLSGTGRYAPVAVSLVVLGVFAYVFRVPVLVGIGVLVVLAPALDYLPLEDGIRTVLSRDVDSVTGRESRFDSEDGPQRTRQFPLEVDRREKSPEDGTCPDCGVDLDRLLVGSHCPNCGNPEVVGDGR